MAPWAQLVTVARNLRVLLVYPFGMFTYDAEHKYAPWFSPILDINA